MTNDARISGVQFALDSLCSAAMFEQSLWYHAVIYFIGRSIRKRMYVCTYVAHSTLWQCTLLHDWWWIISVTEIRIIVSSARLYQLFDIRRIYNLLRNLLITSEKYYSSNIRSEKYHCSNLKFFTLIHVFQNNSPSHLLLYIEWTLIFIEVRKRLKFWNVLAVVEIIHCIRTDTEWSILSPTKATEATASFC